MNRNIDSIKSSNNMLSVEKINDILEQKYSNLLNNIQSAVISYINNTEERITSNINDVKSLALVSQTTQNQVNVDLIEYLKKYNNSSRKGGVSEVKLDVMLNQAFEKAEIINTTGKTGCGDFIVKREGLRPLLFENKAYVAQVDDVEINKFIKNVDTNEGCHGILVSHNSRICNRKNYQIEIHKNSILIYLGLVDYDVDKIKIAIDIIDNLSSKLFQVGNNVSISEEMLEDINNEYSMFSSKKEAFMTHLRESNKKSIEFVTNFELPTLCNFLSEKFATTKLNSHICKWCKIFIGKNKMSLAAHKKRCSKNPDSNKSSVMVDTSSDEFNMNDVIIDMDDEQIIDINDELIVANPVVKKIKKSKKNTTSTKT
jgi:hypothetical protein